MNVNMIPPAALALEKKLKAKSHNEQQVEAATTNHQHHNTTHPTIRHTIGLWPRYWVLVRAMYIYNYVQA
jgi:hypothetical protein